jgi:hypothetical protein
VSANANRSPTAHREREGPCRRHEPEGHARSWRPVTQRIRVGPFSRATTKRDSGDGWA